MWLVLLSHKGSYRYHSAHKDEGKAKEWQQCKTYDGDDAIVVKLDREAIDEIIRYCEEA